MMADTQPTRPIEVVDESAWRDKAECLHLPVDLFFPEKGDCNTVDTARQAKQVCAQCPVRVQCLEYALEHEQSYGVFGGMTVRERAKERKKREALPNPDAPYAALVWLADAIAYGEVA